MVNNKGLTFVYGCDDFLVDRRAKFVFEEVSNGAGEVYDLGDPNNVLNAINNASSAIRTVPMFPESETIWLRAACFLSDIALSTEKKDAIGNFLDLITSVRDKNIILSASPVDKRTKIFKDLCKNADTTEVGEDSNLQSARDMVRIFISERKSHITSSAVDLLAMKCGGNSRLLKQEIDKLSCYIADTGETISQEMVSELVEDDNEGNFFDTVEKFFQRDLDGTLIALKRYFFNNNDARPLLAAFTSRTRAIIQLKALLESKKISLSSISKNNFSYLAKQFYMDQNEKSSFNIFSQNAWYLSKIAHYCINFTFDQLLDFQTQFTGIIPTLPSQSSEQANHLKKLIVHCLKKN